MHGDIERAQLVEAGCAVQGRNVGARVVSTRCLLGQRRERLHGTCEPGRRGEGRQGAQRQADERAKQQRTSHLRQLGARRIVGAHHDVAADHLAACRRDGRALRGEARAADDGVRACLIGDVGGEMLAERCGERRGGDARALRVADEEHDLGRRRRLHIARQQRVHHLRRHERAARRAARHRDGNRDRLEEERVTRDAEAAGDVTLERARDERDAAQIRAVRIGLVALREERPALVDDEGPVGVELRGRLDGLIEDVVAQRVRDAVRLLLLLSPVGDEGAEARSLHEDSRAAGETALATGEYLRHEVGRLFELALHDGVRVALNPAREKDEDQHEHEQHERDPTAEHLKRKRDRARGRAASEKAHQ